MYFYLFDAFLREKKYEIPLAKIEGRLFDLGLQGKSEKLTILKSMKELVENALKRGADTLVAVGNDETLSKVIRFLGDQEILLGFIPLGGKSIIADLLGIPYGAKACDVLSARLVERLDLGKANDAYFLSFLEVAAGKDLFIECDERYTIEPIGSHHVTVFNFGHQGRDPRDGILEAVIQPEAEERKRLLGRRHDLAATILPIRTMRIKSLGRSLVAYADGQTVVKTPMTVTVIPKKIRMIVGKHRAFA